MNCQISGETLSAYLDRALSNAEQASIAMHLETCPRCVQEVDRLLQTKTLLRQQTMPHMPADLREAIEAATVFKKSWWKRSIFEDRWAPVVLGLATVAGSFIFLRWYHNLHVNVPEQLVQKWTPIRRAGDSTRLALHHEPPAASDDCRDESRGC